VTRRKFCYSTFKVLTLCCLRCQSTRGIKTDIKQQTFRIAYFSSAPKTDMGSNKLLPKHKGPYQVIGRRQSIYIIEDRVKGKQIRTHDQNLRPFVFNLTQVNHLDVAQQNKQEFIDDGILAHRGSHHRRSTIEFLVRWKARIAGNHTRLSCMWTSFMIIYEIS
jgi:hypothetical protein